MRRRAARRKASCVVPRDALILPVPRQAPRRQYCGAPRGVIFRFAAQLRNSDARCEGELQPAISTPACPFATPRARCQRQRHTACLSSVGLSLGPPWRFAMLRAPSLLFVFCVWGFVEAARQPPTTRNHQCLSLIRLNRLDSQRIPLPHANRSRLLDYPVHHRMSKRVRHIKISSPAGQSALPKL